MTENTIPASAVYARDPILERLAQDGCGPFGGHRQVRADDVDYVLNKLARYTLPTGLPAWLRSVADVAAFCAHWATAMSRTHPLAWVTDCGRITVTVPAGGDFEVSVVCGRWSAVLREGAPGSALWHLIQEARWTPTSASPVEHDRRLVDAVAKTLHAHECGCPDYTGVTDEDPEPERLARSALDHLAASGFSTAPH